MPRNWTAPFCVSLLIALLAGCGGPSYVRDTDYEGLDDPAMSTGIDRRDLQKLLHESIGALRNSAAMADFQQLRDRPRIAIYPLANETSEHIDSQLDAMLSDIESYLVESRAFTVISHERQRQLMAEVDRQYGGGFDPSRIAEYNKQLGTEYFITGKVFSADERTAEGRRVQYFLFLQLLEVSTGAIQWQHKSELSKALLR